ncbi:MAG: GNAT family N-acetyltransferase [Anaerolineaceae bacterium]|nr:GNAT family N-acetyltransferase [Anaerolineaceae bacterium]
MAEVIIRRVTKDDTDALAEMWLALVAYHQQLTEDLPAASRGGEHRYVRRIMERLDDPYTCALAAEMEGQVVGFVLGMVIDLMPDIFDQKPSGFLADIYVEPHVRRQGVGRSLVNELMNWFRACGISTFDWHVASNNPEGLAFWRSIGGRDVMIRMRADVGAKND